MTASLAYPMADRKILLIEDERPIAENILYTLERETFQSKWISRGSEAVSAFQEFTPDLIILDINLPDVTGFDVCRNLRKISQKPILFLSARQEEIDRVLALELGGDDYLMKPFSLRELVARLRAILRRTDNMMPPGQTKLARKHFAISIDANRQRVDYFSQKLELSRYEFHIVCTLASRPGWVFSRDQLIDRTMGELSAPFDRTIDAHIKSIRAKMRRIDPNIEVIETHRGFGYSLKEQS